MQNYLSGYQNLNIPQGNSQFTPLPVPEMPGIRESYITPEQAQALYGYNPQPVQPQVQGQSMPELSPEAIEYLKQLEAGRQANQQAQANKLQQDMTSWNPINIEGHPELSKWLNLPFNAEHDIVNEIGGGIVNMLTDPKKNVIDPLYNYYAGMAYDGSNAAQRALRAPKDMYNTFIGEPTKLSTESVGKVAENLINGDYKGAAKEAKRVGGEFYNNFMENPFIVSSILAPKATNALVGKTVRGVGQVAEKAGIPVGEASRTVAATIDAAKVKYGAQRAGVQDANKAVRKASTQDLARVIRNTREGNERVPLNEKQMKLKEDYLKSALEYEKVIDDNALVSPREMAAIQYVADVEGRTFQDVRRLVKPQLDALVEGVEDPFIKFQNRLDAFEHEVNSINKTAKTKLNLKDSRKISELTGDEEAVFKKHLTDTEFKQMLDANATVGETIQYLRDVTRDTFTGRKYIDKVAQNAKYQENMAKLANLAAETGDATIQHFYEGMKLADRGEIFPSTFAGADIPAGTTVSEIGRRYQGKSSSREFGTATPEAVAKVYKENIGEFVDDVFRGKVFNDISNNILNGTIDGTNALVRAGDKNLRYINPEHLINGDLSTAIKGASKVATEGFIPISKAYVDAIESYLVRPESLLKGFWGDSTRASKQSMLASGNYLGGNTLSGAFGTLINSDSLSGTVSDFVKSIGAKGRLAKELGIYRYTDDVGRYHTGLGRFLGQSNRKIGGKFVQDIDAGLQNFFAEMNANRVLRQNGAKSFRDIDKVKLANIIEDIKLSSMMKPTYSVIPTKLQSTLGPLQPFINWTDTSLQTTYNMYRRHPYLMGAASASIFGNIGLDQELQNRLGLKVYTDKPLVSYKFDSKTGGVKETTMNFLPQMTPMQLLQHPKEIIRSGVPFLSPMLQAIQGKNVYGQYMKRTHAGQQFGTRIQDGRRYKVNPKTGRFEILEGGMADEMLSTAIRNLFGPVNLVNRTVLPAVAAGISATTGKDVRYYQPYDQSIFGSFNVNQPDTPAAMLSTGNPSRERTLMDVIHGLGTYYERPYNPSEDAITGNQMRRIRRGAARDIRREEYNRTRR